MRQVATMRLLSCSMRASMGKPCVATRLQQTTITIRHSQLAPHHARTSNCNVLFKRNQSTTASSSRRQQSTAMNASTIRGQQQVATKPSVFKQMGDSLHSFLLKPRNVPVPRWVSSQHYTVTLSEVCGHASFILVAVSYAMDDFLELRIIAVAGSRAMLFFTYFHPHGRVLWLPFKWNVLFIAINSYRIGNVFARRLQAEKLPEELMIIRDNHFYVLDPVDFYKLVHLGRRETFKPGDLVVAQGNMNRFIRLVVDGELKVLRDGFSTYSLEEGNFVSESGLHADEEGK